MVLTSPSTLESVPNSPTVLQDFRAFFFFFNCSFKLRLFSLCSRVEDFPDSGYHPSAVQLAALGMGVPLVVCFHVLPLSVGSLLSFVVQKLCRQPSIFLQEELFCK